MNGVVVTTIPDVAWGNPKIARAVGDDRDPWGVLAPLRGTPWEDLIPIVPASILDQAFRGHATPLMKILGPPPRALMRRLPVQYAQCRERHACINAGPLCRPGPKMPDCWEGEGLDSAAVAVASQVARLWREGTIVIVLEDS